MGANQVRTWPSPSIHGYGTLVDSRRRLTDLLFYQRRVMEASGDGEDSDLRTHGEGAGKNAEEIRQEQPGIDFRRPKLNMALGVGAGRQNRSAVVGVAKSVQYFRVHGEDRSKLEFLSELASGAAQRRLRVKVRCLI